MTLVKVALGAPLAQQSAAAGGQLIEEQAIALMFDSDQDPKACMGETAMKGDPVRC